MPEQWAGELDLTIRTRDGISSGGHQYHRGALRILRPIHLDHSGQVCYTLVNPGGAYLGDDHYRIALHVEAGASLLLTTQSATKVYRTPQGPATQRMDVVLDDAAVLESLPDQVIIYREGSYRQSCVVTMHPGASLLMAEVVTPGWAPDGSAFGYDELRLRTEVWIDGGSGRRLFAVDQLRLVPTHGGGIEGVGQMEGHSHVGQLILVDRRIDDDLLARVAGLCADAPAEVGQSSIGITTDDGVRGLVVRSLGRSTEDLVALHESVASSVRRLWRDQDALNLRKY